MDALRRWLRSLRGSGGAAEAERRSGADRRVGDRRSGLGEPPLGNERRSGTDRRSGQDRRSG